MNNQQTSTRKLPCRVISLHFLLNFSTHKTCHRPADQDMNFCIVSMIGLQLLMVIIMHTSATKLGKQRQPFSCCRCRCKGTQENVIIDCSFSGIHDVPRCKDFPTYATKYLLNGNSVEHIPAYSFSIFRNLVFLNLSSNAIQKLDLDAFSGLRNLEYLILDNNSLPYRQGVYLNETFIPLVSLKVLKINDNNVDGTSGDYPGPALQHLPSLQTLYIDALANRYFGLEFKSLLNLTHLKIASAVKRCTMFAIEPKTFENLPELTHVRIIRCNLYHVHPGSFRHQKRIELLDLSGNVYLGFEGATNATTDISSTLQRLHLNRIIYMLWDAICVIVKKSFTDTLTNTSLVEFTADDNKIEAFEPGAMGAMPETLQNVSLRGHALKFGPYVLEISSMRGLTNVDLTGMDPRNVNYFDTIILVGKSRTLYDTSRGMFDHDEFIENGYEELYFSDLTDDVENNEGYYGNLGSASLAIVLPPNLTSIMFPFGQKYVHIKALKFSYSSVAKVDISSNLFTIWKGPVTGLETVKHIDVSNNMALYSSPNFFVNFPNLIFLNVSNNRLGYILKKELSLFKPLTKLEILDLSGNQISQLPHTIFESLVSLKHLNLSCNKISNVSFVLLSMKNMLSINLAKNNIRYLSTEAISRIGNISYRCKSTLTFDLSYNPLSCICRHLYLLKWIQEFTATKRINFGNLTNYGCVLNTGSKIKLKSLSTFIETLEIECYNYFGLCTGLTAVVVLTLSLIVVGVLHRFRWKIRYFYYAAKLKYSRGQDATDEEFEFDAFVSYAEEDQDFVINHLVVKLNNLGMKLNLHHETFTPGRPIVQSIIEAIKTSRHTLILLSKSYLESYWCIYEMQMAHMETVTTQREVLLIVLLEDIPARTIPTEIIYHIKTHSYSEYPPPEEREIFWRKLAVAIQK